MRHMANTIEPSVCGGDAVLCRITLTTCYNVVDDADDDNDVISAVCQHPMILDAKSDPEKIQVVLSRLQGRMDALHERATTFKNYQKNFKVSGIRTSTCRGGSTGFVGF